jgi:hypothetical protein
MLSKVTGKEHNGAEATGKRGCEDATKRETSKSKNRTYTGSSRNMIPGDQATCIFIVKKKGKAIPVIGREGP